MERRAAGAARAGWIAALALAACAEEPRTITIEVVPGHETGAFSEAPAAARIDVTAADAEGDTVAEASAAPGGALDFGEIPASTPLGFEVVGVDAAGATVVRGRSASGIVLAAVDGDVLPLFAQRLGAWARPPGELARARVGAPAGVLAERYVVLTGGEAPGGGDAAYLEAYDLLTWRGTASGPLPRAARSLVARGDALLLVDDAGATWVDLAAGTTAGAELPAGLGSFAEVAGGRTIEGADGRAFVVGATRAAGETRGVLIVEADGSLGAAALGVARRGAAAVWLDGAGLVVAGGSATGAGVEVLGDGATAFAPRPFGEDAVEGAGAVVLGAGEVALVGGTLAGAAAPTRRLAPGCAAACAAAVVDGAALPEAVAGVAAFALPGGRLVAVGGEAAGGLVRSWVVDPAAAAVVELPLREPRAGATPVPAPNGTLALLGGAHPDGTPALTIEVLFPE